MDDVRRMLRVWDSERGRYLEERVNIDSQTGRLYTEWGKYLDEPRYVPEHCLGIMDRHDKWIFENDICRDLSGNPQMDNRYPLYVVAWWPLSYCLAFREIRGEAFQHPLVHTVERCYEVVGNSHKWNESTND